MSLFKQRKELAEIMKEAKKRNEELKKSFEPKEIDIGFWFKYKDRTFVFKGLKEDLPEFIEYKKIIDPTSIKCDRYGNILDESREIIKDENGYYRYKLEGEDMAVDQNGKWVGNTTKIFLELSDCELERWEAAKDFVLCNNNKIEFDKKLAFINICNFIKGLDTNNMDIIEALFYNKVTNKTFVKNSWSEEAKQELQMFYENNRKFTQKKDKIDSNTSQISLDSTRYSIYKGNWASKQGLEQQRKERLKELELKIGPLYNEFKEYENLKRDLNL